MDINTDAKQGTNKRVWWGRPLRLFGEITGWIAAPIIVALILGKYLDKKFDTSPWYFLGLTGFAFIISIVSIARISMRYIKEIEEEAKSKKEIENNNK